MKENARRTAILTGEENAQKARHAKCWQSVRASLFVVSKLLVPSYPSDGMLFAVGDSVPAFSASAFRLSWFLSSHLRLSLPATHNCASAALLLHLSDTGNAATSPSGLRLCMAPLLRIPLPDRTNSPPFAFVRSSDCIFGPPATQPYIYVMFILSVPGLYIRLYSHDFHAKYLTN